MSGLRGGTGLTAPESVFDACLDHGHPVYLMGNTVHPFMRSLDAEIQRRAVA